MKKIVWLISLISISVSAFSQQDSTRLLNEVIIQGNRIQTGFNDVSANIIIVNAAQIQQAPSLSIPDVLHYFAGIDIRSRGVHGVQADAGIRGSTFDQVLILINGIKISDMQTGHHSLNLPIDMDNVDRIEILKGPASRIYGQNAFAGAINIVTKNPNKTYIKVQATGGEYGLGGGRLSASVHNNNVNHYIAASRDFSDGYKYNTDYVISNYFYQSGWSNKAGKWGVLAGLTDRSFGANGFYASPAFQDQYESVQTSLMSLSLQNTVSKNISVMHRLYWRRNQDEYLFVRDNPTLYRNLHTNNTVGYDANATIRNPLGTTGLGIDINYLALTSNNLGNHERTVATLFAEHRFQFLHNKLDVTPGVQFNYYSDFGANFFPGIDAGFSLNQYVKAYANWGYTYRVPSYTDLYYSDPANVGNPDLEPEYAISYEAGLKFLELKWLSAQVAYFVRNGNNIIDWTKQNETDPWQPDNLIGVDMQGLDLNFSITPSASNFLERLDAGYTYIDAEKAEDIGLSRYALENLRNQVVVTVMFNYGIGLHHTISYRYSDRVNLPEYSVFDTRLSWRGKSVEIFADVTNLFDKSYLETNLVTLPGRWFKAGISYQFNVTD